MGRIIENSVSLDGTEKIKRVTDVNEMMRTMPLSAKRRLAKQGEGEAQLMLGVAYANGDSGVKQDFEQSFYWFRQAADNGVVEAQWQLGLSYLRGDGTKKDSVKGFSWIKKAAEGGQIEAQNQVGVFYYLGMEGIEKNTAEAIKWYEKAAYKGFAAAQYNLGNIFAFCKDVEENMPLAVSWWSKSAEQGHQDAQYNLGFYYNSLEEYDKSFPLFMKSAEQGNAEAQFMVAYAYEAGHGVLKSNSSALLWAKKSAEGGNSCGQCMLGQKYFHTKEDFMEGIYWLLKSVEQDNEQAKKFLMEHREDIYSGGVRLEEEGEREAAALCYNMAKDLGYVKTKDNGSLLLYAIVAIFIICVILKFVR